jgi:hypothetical protein
VEVQSTSIDVLSTMCGHTFIGTDNFENVVFNYLYNVLYERMSIASIGHCSMFNNKKHCAGALINSQSQDNRVVYIGLATAATVALIVRSVRNIPYTTRGF